MVLTAGFGVRIRARIFLLLTVGVMAAGVMAKAQSAPAKLPEFEVATIKPFDPASMGVVGITNVSADGRVTIRRVSLKRLICIAFNLSAWQVPGDGMDKDLYVVEAKAPEPPAASMFDTRHSGFGMQDERLRQMLQALLIDRFHLTFHRESKVGTVSLLEVNGKIVHLLPTKALAASPAQSGQLYVAAGHGWAIRDMAMPQLAKSLSDSIVHHAVVDHTALEGAFDFESKTILTSTDFQTPNFPETFLGVLDEMGLKLETSKGPVESFLVDHWEAPTAN